MDEHFKTPAKKKHPPSHIKWPGRKIRGDAAHRQRGWLKTRNEILPHEVSAEQRIEIVDRGSRCRQTHSDECEHQEPHRQEPPAAFNKHPQNGGQFAHHESLHQSNSPHHTNHTHICLVLPEQLSRTVVRPSLQSETVVRTLTSFKEGQHAISRHMDVS